jgi:phosphohistidine phosphatase
MFVVLFRHGIAVDRDDPACPPDPDRPLTEEGERRTRRAALGLKALGVRPEVVVSSDWVRAERTAEIAAEALGGVPDGNFVRTDDLRPTVDPREFLGLLDRTPCREMLVVGHNPHLSSLLSLLVGAPRQPFAWLKKAGAARIDLGLDGRPPGRLVWLLEPRVLRRLGSGDAA